MAHGPDGHLILGATVRTLGAWPSGWRYPGAHRDPRDDRAALTRIAASAEGAGLQFLYFGDWLATSPEFEFTDPYLLARIEPLAAIGYLAAITSRIGLIATVSSSHAEPYSTARSSASIDILSAGRVGLVVTSGSETQSASNFGWRNVHADADRIAAASEFVHILRGLWDSWDEDAIVGAAENSRDLAARTADVSFVSPKTLQDAVDGYARAKALAESHGRDPDEFLLLTSIFPIVGETREDAWRIYDELVALVPVEIVADRSEVDGLPANRTIRVLSSVLGVPLTGIVIDEVVPDRLAQRFSDAGRHLVEVVTARSGRTIGGSRGITFRHLLVAHAVVAPIVVGSTQDVADHLETWFRRRATDGFTVLSAFAEQFDDFARLVVPELTRRGLFPAEYRGSTLRDHLGLPVPANSFAARAAVR
jgi:alkanesulfonate monooxygenase SsuD/methylene tetrahydromethanopterin reductase-like flavin-dependent oxidoreductase (luciferase family)